MPEHAQKVREKHRLQDSLRSLELIETLAADSTQQIPKLAPQD